MSKGFKNIEIRAEIFAAELCDRPHAERLETRIRDGSIPVRSTSAIALMPKGLKHVLARVANFSCAIALMPKGLKHSKTFALGTANHCAIALMPKGLKHWLGAGISLDAYQCDRPHAERLETQHRLKALKALTLWRQMQAPKILRPKWIDFSRFQRSQGESLAILRVLAQEKGRSEGEPPSFRA